MIAEVAVFGFTLKPVAYTYSIPSGANCQPGQLVRVPFGKSIRQGIILRIGQEPPPGITIKEIASIESDKLGVSQNQLNLADWLSKRYFISVAEALHLILPRLPKNPTSSYQKVTKAISQELCLFPTLRQAEAAAKSSQGLIFSHSGSIEEFSRAWQEISQGRIKIIFGARSALFAPFSNLKKISIFQTESDLYKEERRPYYRATDIARALADIHHASIKAISYSPRVQDNFLIPHLVKKPPYPSQVKLVNLRQSKILSQEMIRFIEDNKTDRTLVFLNRKSERGPLLCRVCKVRSYVTDPSTCPTCGSADVKFQLLNLATLTKELGHRSNLVFATQQIFFQETPPFKAIVIASADAYLNRSNYLSTEKTYQMITNLLRLLSPEGKMLIQTAYPDEEAVVWAIRGDYQAFYEDELEKRRELEYPPFAELVKLTYQKKGPLPDLHFKNLEVFGPFDEGSDQYFVAKGRDLSELDGLGRAWKLDIDPPNL